jgi:hypothetical protein
MGNTTKRGLVLVLLSIILHSNILQGQGTPKSIVRIKGIRTAYLPFSALKEPAFEIVNSKLNIAVTDIKGNMLQINGIDVSKLTNGILQPNAFRTIMIMANGGTFTDDADENLSSLIEIKCADNKVGTPITVGIKTTILQNGKNLRVYATLYGTIPSVQYKQTN